MSGFLDHEATMEELTLQTQEVTMTVVDLGIGPQGKRMFLKGTGWAKTDPEDEFDSDHGHRLSLARALEDLAAELRQSLRR